MTAATAPRGAGTTGARPGVPPWPLIRQVLLRSATSLRRIPAGIVPVIVMPVFFTVAFSGTFSGLTDLPGYPTDNILNWMIPYACLQSASFAALASAFALGRDLEGGFYDRLLLAPAPRWTVPTASVLWAMVRALLPLTITLVLGVLGGMTFPGGFAAVWWLAFGAFAVAALGSLWGLGVMYRIQRQSAGGLVQISLFVVMFLSVGTVPLDLQQGWLPHVARWNPITYILDMARSGFVGTVEWSAIWPGLLAIAVGGALLAWWAERGWRRLVS